VALPVGKAPALPAAAPAGVHLVAHQGARALPIAPGERGGKGLEHDDRDRIGRRRGGFTPEHDVCSPTDLGPHYTVPGERLAKSQGGRSWGGKTRKIGRGFVVISFYF